MDALNKNESIRFRSCNDLDLYIDMPSLTEERNLHNHHIKYILKMQALSLAVINLFFTFNIIYKKFLSNHNTKIAVSLMPTAIPLSSLLLCSANHLQSHDTALYYKLTVFAVLHAE